MLCASFTEADLPRAHLIHAGFSLPFCPPQEFPALWARIRQALAPGGVFAGQLFGTRDTWADDPDMTFCTRHQAEVLLDGLDIFRLEETERDGHAARLQDAVDLDAVQANLVGVVQHALEPAHISVWIRPRE